MIYKLVPLDQHSHKLHQNFQNNFTKTLMKEVQRSDENLSQSLSIITCLKLHTFKYALIMPPIFYLEINVDNNTICKHSQSTYCILK